MDNVLKQELEDIKSTLNHTLTQLTLVLVEKNILQRAFLGVCAAKLPEDEYRNIYTNFVDKLETEVLQALDGLQDILFDPPGSFLRGQKFEHMVAIGRLKENRSYIPDSERKN